jgi:predicted ATPase
MLAGVLTKAANHGQNTDCVPVEWGRAGAGLRTFALENVHQRAEALFVLARARKKAFGIEKELPEAKPVKRVSHVISTEAARVT